MKQEISVSEMKQELVKILESVDEFCEQHNLTYYMAGGTLLGAVRHKGFIPWDDDIDIVMPRNDYEYFLKFYKDNKNFFKVIDYKNYTGYPYPFAKVIDTKTVLEEKNIDAPQLGIYVDVFPLEMMQATKAQLCKLYRKMRVERILLGLKYTKKVADNRKYKQIIKRILAFILKALPVKWLVLAIDKDAQRYNVSSSPQYCAAMTAMTYGMKEIMPSKYFEEVERLEFEGRNFNAPKEYEKVLKSLYGDYMKLPPLEKRNSHHDFKAWRIIERK